jgi:hypothetical protein
VTQYADVVEALHDAALDNAWTDKMTRIVADLCFVNMDDCVAAADTLREAGYDVEISYDIVDDCGPHTWAEARKTTELTGEELRRFESATFEEVSKLTNGAVIACGAVGDDYVPFCDYRDEAPKTLAPWCPWLTNKQEEEETE